MSKAASDRARAAAHFLAVAGVLVVLAVPSLGKQALAEGARGGDATPAAGKPVVLELSTPYDPDKSEVVRGEVWKLSAGDATRLEENVHLPPGSYLIERYARYYFGIMSKGRHLIVAHYIISYSGPRGRYLNELRNDEINDGGCAEIHFVYEVESTTARYLWCNGNG